MILWFVLLLVRGDSVRVLGDCVESSDIFFDMVGHTKDHGANGYQVCGGEVHGTENLGLWQTRMKDLLAQRGCLKALQELMSAKMELSCDGWKWRRR